MLWLFVVCALAAPGDFDRGNALLAAGRAADAEEAFRSALNDDPTSAPFQAQIGLALMEQGKLAESEAVLEELLRQHPDDTAGLWYLGVARFKQGDDRGTIGAMTRFLSRIDPSSPQYPGAHWFRLTAYNSVFQREGLRQPEIDLWLASLDAYLAVSPEEPRIAWLRDYIRSNRPPTNVERWQVVSSAEAAAQALGDFLAKPTPEDAETPATGR